MVRPTLQEFARLVKDKDAFELLGPREADGGRRLIASVAKSGSGYLVTLPGQDPVLITTVAEARALLASIGFDIRDDWELSF